MPFGRITTSRGLNGKSKFVQTSYIEYLIFDWKQVYEIRQSGVISDTLANSKSNSNCLLEHLTYKYIQ